MSSMNGFSKYSANGSYGPEEIISYEVDHLATLADTGNRVMDMNSIVTYLTTLRNQIQTLRCLMIFEKHNIVVMYEKTQEILARFGYHEITHLQYQLESESGSTFDNLTSFITFNGEDHRQEVHIFRTVNSPSKSLVSYIEKCQHNVKQMAVLPKPLYNGMTNGTRSLPVQLMDPSLQLARPTLIREHDHPSNNRSSEFAANYHPDSNRHQRAVTLAPLSPEMMLSRDLEVFKHCHTDIDAFLVQTRDGQMPLAASLEEYVVCLKKFKVAFILLGRLNGQIKNPNAPEWVHRLMKLLTKICPAADIMIKERRNNSAKSLAPCIVSPLLSREAVQMLQLCLTSNEMQLWESLGKAWRETIDDYKDEIPPLNLQFLNGSSVPADLFPAVIITGSKSLEENIYGDHIYSYPVQKHHKDQNQFKDSQYKNGSPRSAINVTSEAYINHFRPSKISPSELRTNPNYIQKNKNPPQKFSSSIANYRPKSLSRENLYDHQTSFYGQNHEVDKNHHIYNHHHSNHSSDSFQMNHIQSATSTPNMMDSHSSRGSKNGFNGAFVDGIVDYNGSLSTTSGIEPDYPFEPLEDIVPDVAEPLIRGPSEQDIQTYNFVIKARGRGSVIYLCFIGRKANNRNELTVEKGQYLELLDNKRHWWKMRDAANNVGYVPGTILMIAEDNSTDHLVSSQVQQTYSREQNSNSNNISNHSPFKYEDPAPNPPYPPPPPPPPVPSIVRPTNPPVFRKNSKKKEIAPEPITPQDLLLEELRGKLKTPLRKTQSFKLEISSTAGNFRQWLNTKKFTENTKSQLSGKSVRDVLACSEEELVDLIGQEEFDRLNPHLSNLRNKPKRIN